MGGEGKKRSACTDHVVVRWHYPPVFAEKIAHPMAPKAQESYHEFLPHAVAAAVVPAPLRGSPQRLSQEVFSKKKNPAT